MSRMQWWQVYAVWPDDRRSGATFNNPQDAEIFFDAQVAEQCCLSASGIQGDNAVAIVWTYYFFGLLGSSDSGVVKMWERGGKVVTNPSGQNDPMAKSKRPRE